MAELDVVLARLDALDKWLSDQAQAINIAGSMTSASGREREGRHDESSDPMPICLR